MNEKPTAAFVYLLTDSANLMNPLLCWKCRAEWIDWTFYALLTIHMQHSQQTRELFIFYVPLSKIKFFYTEIIFPLLQCTPFDINILMAAAPFIKIKGC